MNDTENTNEYLPYWILASDSGGGTEDERGSYDNYEEAYKAFEETVRFIDEMKATVDDYALGIDLVQLIHDFNVLHNWQRPPWKTVALLKKWSKRNGYGEQDIAPIRFIKNNVGNSGE